MLTVFSCFIQYIFFWLKHRLAVQQITMCVASFLAFVQAFKLTTFRAGSRAKLSRALGELPRSLSLAARG